MEENQGKQRVGKQVERSSREGFGRREGGNQRELETALRGGGEAVVEKKIRTRKEPLIFHKRRKKGGSPLSATSVR